MTKQKLYYSKYFCPETLQLIVAAEFTGIMLQLNEINKKYDPINLVTKQGVLNRSNAILRYLTSGTPLNGSNSQQNNQINTWYEFFNTELLPLLTELYGQIFGQKAADQNKYSYCMNEIAKNLKILDESLKIRSFFVGNSITIIDITLCCYLESLFKLVIAESERKKYVNLFRWYSYVRSIPVFTKYFGKVFLCGNSPFKIEFNASSKSQAKPEQKKQQKKTQPKSQTKTQTQSETKQNTESSNTFKFDDFKREFQNSHNQLQVLKNLLDTLNQQKFSIWKIHYDKDESEGKVLFLTQNLANGSLQRIENIRKVAFGTWGVYGDEGNFEVRGVMIWQGTQIHPIWKQHPSFEYHKFTKLSPQNLQDRKLIIDYIMEAQTVEGLFQRYGKRIL